MFRRSDGGAQVFATRHHVVQIDVVRLNKLAGELFGRAMQAVERVVHAADEYGLIAHPHAGFGQRLHRPGCPCRDFPVGVEVRVQCDFLHPVPAHPADV